MKMEVKNINFSSKQKEHLTKEDKTHIRFINCYFLCMMSYTVIKRLFGNDMTGTIVAALISFPFLAVVAFPMLTLLIRTRLIQMMSIVIIFSFVYVVSILRDVSLQFLIPYYAAGLWGIILAGSIYSVNDLNALYRSMLRMSKWLLLIAIFIIFTNRSIIKYSLFYSYLLSIALFLHTNEFLNHNKFYLFYILLELILILFFGSRGPILCYVVFLFVKLYLSVTNPIPKVFFTGIVMLFVSKYQEIGELVNNLFLRLHIYSRSIYLFFNNLEYTSGRDMIQEISKELIAERPLFGWGVCGGYDILQGYPHNIILEMQLNFGIFLGYTLFIVLLLIILYTFLRSKGNNKSLFLIFICYGFVTLFVSVSYLIWGGFYLMLGLMFNLLHRRKHQIYY